MQTNEFTQRLKNQNLPVILDIWAPWCGPYRLMEPTLNSISKEYMGRVDVWKLNADAEPNIIKNLRVIGIPTLIGYAGGKRVFHKIGYQSGNTLRELFEAACGNRPVPQGIHPFDRLLRLGNGLFVGVVGWINGPNYLFLSIALLLAISAVYDHCSLCQAIAARLMRGIQSFLFGNENHLTTN